MFSFNILRYCFVLFIYCMFLFSRESYGTMNKYSYYNGLQNHPMFYDIPNRIQRDNCRKLFRICDEDITCCSKNCDKTNKNWSFGVCKYPKM